MPVPDASLARISRSRSCEKRLRDVGLDAEQFRFERIGVDCDPTRCRRVTPDRHAEVRVRVAGRVRTGSRRRTHRSRGHRSVAQRPGRWWRRPPHGHGRGRDPLDHCSVRPRSRRGGRVGRGLKCCCASWPTLDRVTRAGRPTSPSSCSTPRGRRRRAPRAVGGSDPGALPRPADLAVDRYEIPQLLALKFVLHGALGRGVTRRSTSTPTASR